MAKSPEVKLAVFGRAGVGKSGKKKEEEEKPSLCASEYESVFIGSACKRSG